MLILLFTRKKPNILERGLGKGAEDKVIKFLLVYRQVKNKTAFASQGEMFIFPRRSWGGEQCLLPSKLVRHIKPFLT